MTSLTKKLLKFLRCRNSENNEVIKNALSGIMGNDLKSPSNYSVDLQQVSLAAKTGEGKKARETCNTW